jgi:hypothetical protein
LGEHRRYRLGRWAMTLTRRRQGFQLGGGLLSKTPRCTMTDGPPKHVHQTNSTLEGMKISPQGCWTLGGGYCNEYRTFLNLTQSPLTILTTSDTSDISATLPLQQMPYPHNPETAPAHPPCPTALHCPPRSLMVSEATHHLRTSCPPARPLATHVRLTLD